MKRIFRWRNVRAAGIAAIALLAAIQLVPVRPSNPPIETDVGAPANVHAVLRRACYDCHSHETVWPWYARVAPVSWLVVRDVEEGREELNFSTWNRLEPREQLKELRKTWQEVAEGEMPPRIYVRLHHDAVLTLEDRAALREWTRQAGPEREGDDER